MLQAARERTQKKKKDEEDKRAAEVAEEERKQQKRIDERNQKYKVKQDLAYTQAKAEAMDELNDEFLKGRVSKERLDSAIHMHLAADAIKLSLHEVCHLRHISARPRDRSMMSEVCVCPDLLS